MNDHYRGWKITAGFLSGNFGAEIVADETALAWQDALEELFPGAEVSIDWQNAAGVLPRLYWHRVLDPAGNERLDLAEVVRSCLEAQRPVWAEPAKNDPSRQEVAPVGE